MAKDLSIAREQLAQMVTAVHGDPTPSSVPTYMTRDGHENNFLVFQPDGPAQSGRPLVVFIHGGGFIVGKPTDVAYVARQVCDLHNVVAVCPQYRLAPEHQFPTAPHDIWDFLQHVVENASSLRADLQAGFVLGGFSAGGNLAAVAAQATVSHGLKHPLTGVFLVVPVLFTADTVPEVHRALFLSREQNANAYILKSQSVYDFEKAYGADFRSQDYCPVFAPGTSRKHPKTYLQVAGLDPLRDDALVYERILRSNAVTTKLDVYSGLPHGFNFVFPQFEASKQGDQDFRDGIKWLLA